MIMTWILRLTVLNTLMEEYRNGGLYVKKILITGANGFIGSHLVEECIKEGYTVKAL